MPSLQDNYKSEMQMEVLLKRVQNLEATLAEIKTQMNNSAVLAQQTDWKLWALLNTVCDSLQKANLLVTDYRKF